MKKNYITEQGLPFCIEIVKNPRNRLYDAYSMTIRGETKGGKVPKGWTCEQIAHYWIRANIREVTP